MKEERYSFAAGITTFILNEQYLSSVADLILYKRKHMHPVTNKKQYIKTFSMRKLVVYRI